MPPPSPANAALRAQVTTPARFARLLSRVRAARFARTSHSCCEFAFSASTANARARLRSMRNFLSSSDGGGSSMKHLRAHKAPTGVASGLTHDQSSAVASAQGSQPASVRGWPWACSKAPPLLPRRLTRGSTKTCHPTAAQVGKRANCPRNCTCSLTRTQAVERLLAVVEL